MTFLLAGIRWTQEAKAFRLRINCAQKTLIYDVAAWLGSTATYAIPQPSPVLHSRMETSATAHCPKKYATKSGKQLSFDFLTTATQLALALLGCAAWLAQYNWLTVSSVLVSLYLVFCTLRQRCSHKQSHCPPTAYK